MVDRQRTPVKVIKDHTTDMSRAFIKCRSRGHRWDDTAHYTLIPDSKPEAAELALCCERCTTRRFDRMARKRGGRWEFDGRHYEYPDGYLIEPGSDVALTRADYSEELVRRDLGTY
jgi:hypothetical protein